MADEIAQQKLDAAMRAAIGGTAVLFIGAGVSHLVRNCDDKPMPNGNGLSDQLHDELGIDRRKHSLPAIAEFYKKRRGASALRQLLDHSFAVQAIDENLKKLYREDWRRIYTTNYDDSVEFSRSGSKAVSSFTHSDLPTAVPQGAVVHLNGDIKKAVPTDIDDEITLTDRSYAVTNLSESDWMQLFVSDLKLAKAIIFIGYSVSDLDIARILIAQPNLADKTFIFVGDDTDEIELSRIEKYGRVYRTGIGHVFSTIQAARASYVAPTAAEQLYHAVKLDLEDAPLEGTSAKTVFDQLVYGQLPLSAILSGKYAFGENPFLVKRTGLTDIVGLLVGGAARDLFVTGDIASGKTVALFQIARQLLSEGFEVYWVGTGRHVDRDLDIISKVGGDVAVIFDGYADMFDSLKRYLAIRPVDQRLVLSERTVTHEIFRHSLEPIEQFGPVREIALSRLDANEAQGFDALMNFAGLWGSQAGLSPQRRAKYIAADLQGSLYRLLIEIIKSEKVQKEIRDLLSPLEQDENALRFFVTAFIVNVLEYNFWINDWQHFYSIKDIRRTIKEYGIGLGHFINVDASQIYLRSGILSGHILRNFTDDEMILDCLVDMYDCASRNSFRDDEFSKIAFDLRHYNRVEPLFADKKKLYYLTKYFEKIREFPGTSNNSDYWLQFGIATSIHGDLKLAESAFANAYAREKARPNPNTTKIDNYYARFELERAIDEDDKNVAFALARSGAQKLMKQTFMDNNRHYPFKTGRSFSDIAGKHYDKWDDVQRRGFEKICFDIRDRALQWKKHSRLENRDVEFLITDVGKLEKIFSVR